MSDDMFGSFPIDTVVVCHPEPLVAEATAEVLRDTGSARTVVSIGPLKELVSRLSRGADVAVVFDTIDGELGDLFEALWHRGIDIPVVVISERPSASRTVEIMELGGAAILPHDCSVALLCTAVVSAGNQERLLAAFDRAETSAALEDRRERRARAHTILHSLTAIERDTLDALAHGVSITTLARRSGVSVSSARNCVRRLGIKVGARGQLEVAAAGRTLFADAWEPMWQRPPAERRDSGPTRLRAVAGAR